MSACRRSCVCGCRESRSIWIRVLALPSGARSDWSVSLDQLTTSCRNLKAASLVVAWFGNDLRCGSCEVMPGVEVGAKATDPET